MIFRVENRRYLSTDQLRTKALLNAYSVIQQYRFSPAEQLLNSYVTNQYKASLKDLCIGLLLNLTYYKSDDGSLILLFKDMKHDMLARLITYGNGMIAGSDILKVALNF